MTRIVPGRYGLYEPETEHDACGVGFVAHLRGERSRGIVEDGLELLKRLSHRAAAGRDPETGDGAGILVQLPHRFFAREAPKLGIELPPRRQYGVAQVFLPQDATARAACEALFAEVVAEEGQRLLGWRDVPVAPEELGPLAREAAPVIRQLFIARRRVVPSAFERKLYRIRKLVENRVQARGVDPHGRFHVASLSSETLIYKGLLLPRQLPRFYADLRDADFVSALALVHSRFSTNTFPTWELAQPFRFIAHNGEINTLRGNRNWMTARRGLLQTAKLGGSLEPLWPIIVPGKSDSAQFDNMVELLYLGGRTLPHALMMMIPEAWEGHAQMSDERRAFYEYSASLLEPWDGPAAIAFTDGQLIGATLDRNGLRPARYLVTEDDRVILSSETGVIDVPPAQVRRKGRLTPGRMFLVDTTEGRILEDEDVKRDITTRWPYRRWLKRNVFTFDNLPASPAPMRLRGEALWRQQRAFGYTDEDVRTLLVPMAETGKEPVGSMGTDTPLAVLSDQAPSLFSYFHQLFAQVTNPPIDPLREALVMTLSTALGPEGNTFEETPEQCHRLSLPGPILTNGQLARLAGIRGDTGLFETKRLSLLYPTNGGEGALDAAVERLCAAALEAVDAGASILILSDRGVDAEHAAIPALLAVSAVHQRLVRDGIRMYTGLVLETAEAREVHHFACLFGFGASAVNPYLALDTLRALADSGELVMDEEAAQAKFIHAVEEGLLKVMSKMGISTLQSYRGAQLFEAVGLQRSLIERHFTSTPSRVEGVGLPELGREVAQRHARGFGPEADAEVGLLPVGGQYRWRRQGERHKWNPATVAKLQAAVRANDPALFAEYSKLADDETLEHCNLRGLLELATGGRAPVRLDEVEPATELARRFVTGAMSFGSISAEAHETLAIAMNRLGGRSNSGEGGEEARRYTREPNGDSRRSAIKQVASARFGVTAEYLVQADELQIKMAQGAKPGEGGQLPGHKVDERIARVRWSTPGVTLISPPPHHDIYSIEDLAQLIYDLQSVNPKARVSVKLVSEVGVGTIAAGVAKAGAGAVVVSGYEGGTGASPLSSLQHAGLPWELGLAEAQQVLVHNGLRSRIRVQVDGGLRTARDVLVAALLGAEEFGLATASLVSVGCIMLRKCHLNTCSAGIATQDPALREKFQGSPEHVVNFFLLLAEDLRRLMASLGARTLDELVGRVDLLRQRKDVPHEKARKVDLSALLAHPAAPAHEPRHCTTPWKKDVSDHLDHELLHRVEPVLSGGPPMLLSMPVSNTHRAVGSLLSGEIARRHGARGLPDGQVRIRMKGSAGQSFGAFLVAGVTLELEGDANDYVGKGLSGGRIIVSPPEGVRYAAEENVLVGNTALYGATAGEVYLRGLAGERFAVRNSGAQAVVEGVGDHGCEYMTGGAVVVLGRTGRNFAAGMSGGTAYVLDRERTFRERCNLDMVELESLVDESERWLVRGMIERHLHHTGSALARRVLDNWEMMVPQFVKVMPTDYKRVLAARRAARAAPAASESELLLPVAEGRDRAMGKTTGFMEWSRVHAPKRDKAERLTDFRELTLPLAPDEAKRQAGRCMDCGVPFCHQGCPLGNLIPDFNDAVYRGKWHEAYQVLSRTNTFPEFTGRLCPAPCEAACVLAIDQAAVTIEQLEKEISERAFAEGWVKPRPPSRRTGRSVGVVGSGPAGLAAAAQLNAAGHRVTVYERDARLGGLLRYGIPDFKLEKGVIDRRIALMEAEGITFRTGVDVGGAVPFDALRGKHDALVLAMGARRARELEVPGRELAGVVQAMTYLEHQNQVVAGQATLDARLDAKDRRVIILGGGDTGSDCLGTALRQGARNVMQVELLPAPPAVRATDNPWPRWPLVFRTSTSQEEGGERAFALLTKKLSGSDGRLQALHAVRVDVQREPGGPPRIVEVPGSEVTFEVDLLVLAMGFTGPETRPMVDQLGVALSPRGNVQVDARFATSVDGVFCAGDASRGASLIVWALSDGREAARSVDAWLSGGVSALATRGQDRAF